MAAEVDQCGLRQRLQISLIGSVCDLKAAFSKPGQGLKFKNCSRSERFEQIINRRHCEWQRVRMKEWKAVTIPTAFRKLFFGCARANPMPSRSAIISREA